MRKTRIINTLKLMDKELDKIVKIQGTEFDRKRVLSDSDIKQMRKLYKKGFSIKKISDLYGVSWPTVKYNVDIEWRKAYNARRDGKHSGIDHISINDRIKYKRELVSLGVLS